MLVGGTSPALADATFNITVRALALGPNVLINYSYQDLIFYSASGTAVTDARQCNAVFSLASLYTFNYSFTFASPNSPFRIRHFRIGRARGLLAVPPRRN